MGQKNNLLLMLCVVVLSACGQGVIIDQIVTSEDELSDSELTDDVTTTGQTKLLSPILAMGVRHSLMVKMHPL